MIDEKIPQRDRLLKLNKTAIRQMTILEEVHSRQLLKEDNAKQTTNYINNCSSTSIGNHHSKP